MIENIGVQVFESRVFEMSLVLSWIYEAFFACTCLRKLRHLRTKCLEKECCVS